MAGIPKEKGNFIDASGWKIVVKPPYEHKSEFKGEKPFPKRREDGKIVTENSNIFVNPRAKPLLKFANTFLKDPYESFDNQIIADRKKSAKAQIACPFRNMHGKLNPFNKIKDVFGTTVKFPEKKVIYL